MVMGLGVTRIQPLSWSTLFWMRRFGGAYTYKLALFGSHKETIQDGVHGDVARRLHGKAVAGVQSEHGYDVTIDALDEDYRRLRAFCIRVINYLHYRLPRSQLVGPVLVDSCWLC